MFRGAAYRTCLGSLIRTAVPGQGVPEFTRPSVPADLAPLPGRPESSGHGP